MSMLHRVLGRCVSTRSSWLSAAFQTSFPARRFITIDISKSMAASTASKNSKRVRTKQRRDSGRASYRFVDRTRVQVSGGPGGNGSLSMYRISRKHKRRPDGGHGGHGGSIVIVADPKEHSLRWTHPHVIADAGAHGSSQGKNGRNGKNTVLRVPCGVVIRRILDFDEVWDDEAKTVRKLFQGIEEEGDSDQEHEADQDYHSALDSRDLYPREVSSRFNRNSENNNSHHRAPYLASNDYDSDEDSDEDEDDFDYSEVYLADDPVDTFTPWGEREKVVVADLDQPGSYAVVARGGRGGTGSSIFASQHGPLPPQEVLSKYAKPQPGESAFLELELKLIADIGLVGFPNAGKSSLLAAMSRATPHIAPYPFTTLNPLVGYIEYRDGFRVCAADIPGLIAGASMGRGRGHDFLRHLERTKALVYLIDIAGVDGRDPVQDFQTLVDEISAYGDGSMLDRQALLVANKIDLLDDERRQEVMQGLTRVAEQSRIRLSNSIIGISAGVTGEGLSSLSKAIREVVSTASSQQDSIPAASA